MSWQVIRQVPTSGVDANGNAGDGFRVTYETSGGMTDSLFVLRPDYTAANLKALISQAVANHDEVAALKG